MHSVRGEEGRVENEVRRGVGMCCVVPRWTPEGLIRSVVVDELRMTVSVMRDVITRAERGPSEARSERSEVKWSEVKWSEV